MLRRHPLAQALHDGDRGRHGRAGQQHHELLAAGARQRIAAAGTLAHQPGQRLQRAVAGGVPVAVIDVLEVIDVDGHDRHRLVLGLQQRQRFVQAASVQQPGQGVRGGFAAQVADLVMQRRQPHEQRALELRRLEIPGAHLADAVRGIRILHVLGDAGQFAQRAGDPARQQPDRRHGQQQQRQGIAGRGHEQVAQGLQGIVDGALRDDAPARARHRRIACQHLAAPVVGVAHLAGLSAAGGGEGLIVGAALPQAAAVGVIDQRAVAVHDEQRGIVAVEMLAQQPVQHIVLVQVQRARDVAEIAVVGRDDGMGIENHPAAAAGLERLADGRAPGGQRLGEGFADQVLAQQLRGRGRYRQHLALRRHDEAGIEMAQLLFLAPGLRAHVLRARLHVAQHVRAVCQVALQVGQEGVGRAGQLRGIGLVDIQRVAQQQVALHQIAGMQAARQHQDHREQADPQDEAPQIDAEHDAIRQRLERSGGCPANASQAHIACLATACKVLRVAPSRAWIDMPCSTVA